jgi:hypothetical protein
MAKHNLVYKQPQECPECGGQMTESKETAPWDEEVPLFTCQKCGAEYYFLSKDDE